VHQLEIKVLKQNMSLSLCVSLTTFINQFKIWYLWSTVRPVGLTMDYIQIPTRNNAFDFSIPGHRVRLALNRSRNMSKSRSVFSVCG